MVPHYIYSHVILVLGWFIIKWKSYILPTCLSTKQIINITWHQAIQNKNNMINIWHFYPKQKELWMQHTREAIIISLGDYGSFHILSVCLCKCISWFFGVYLVVLPYYESTLDETWKNFWKLVIKWRFHKDEIDFKDLGDPRLWLNL